MKIFEQFKKLKSCDEETKHLKIYKLTQSGKDYKIILTKKSANRFTIFHCVDDTILLEQVPRFYRLAGKFPGTGDRLSIYKFQNNNNCVTIFVIKGKPNGITGLDDGIFRSASKFDENLINIMTLRNFKTL